ncbi:hypothetical protein HMPREF1508_1251 [Shuttleworthella sp. MSX8B]|uniref:hypothetical protein n=1 Tax=Shuttleworthella sp. MSX8B TaxID=936574 RepID=UPI0004483A5B|nr:hypothetical protein [Shuttleworthia sp. MSX8B]EUB16450.1 hypothetical protein HMPREF1508_1251 [Shuttleworthia sp. MSX8B]
MGWTERETVLTSYEEIIKYLEDQDGFHDYRIGNVHYDGSKADVTIEEVVPGAKIQDSTGLVWDFHFKGVTSFEMSVDVVMGFWIYEVERGEKPNEIAFNLDSGFLGIAAEHIEFGIPSQEKSEA